VPADREAHLPRLTRRESDAHRERAVLRLLKHVSYRARFLVASLPEMACPREFVPVPGQAVKPLPAEMVVDMLDIAPVGSDCQITLLFWMVHRGRGEMENAEPVLSCECVDAAVAAVIAQGAGNRIVDRCLGLVFNREFEERDGHRRVAIVMRDE